MTSEIEVTARIATAGAAEFGAFEPSEAVNAVLAEIVGVLVADGVAFEPYHREIYLAAGCIGGSAEALRELERGYIARIPDVIAAKRIPADAVAALCQDVRRRLLVGEPPYLARAIGRGALAGLIAVMATRAATDWFRANAREQARRGEPSSEPRADDDVAARVFGAHYRGELKAAFESAVAELDARERTLLRLHLVEQLTIDDVARDYHVHRATAARQIESAREHVASLTRRHIAKATGLRGSELEELGVLVASQLDLSLSRLLR
jgi:RNA polymerase sigma-70 factor (ECF subfamily)